MPAGIEIYNYVTNQKGSPAIWSDIFAARPPAGFIGRLFVSTDTFEIYRDNGITWDLIGGGGGPAVNIYNSDGSLTGTRVVTMGGNNLTFEGGASTARIAMSANNNVPRIFSFRTAGVPRWAFRIDGNETGANVGAHFALRAYDDIGTFIISPIIVERSTGQKVFLASETLLASNAALQGVYNLTTVTIAGGVSLTGGNPQAAEHNNYTVINDGSYTVDDSIFFGAQSNVLRLTSGGSGTATFTQTGNVRSAAANLNQVQYDTSNGSAITYTHVAVGQNLGIYKLSGLGSLTITNAYGQLINDLNEYGNANLTISNRWGIFQNSVNDVNYFGGTTLVGTLINSGYKLDIGGSLRNTTDAAFATTSGNVAIGNLLPTEKLHVTGRIRVTTIDNTVTPINLLTSTINGVIQQTTLANAGGIGGTGTINRLAKFITTNTIGDSLTSDNGTTVLIGQIPLSGDLLQVNGNIYRLTAASGVSTAIKVNSTNAFSSYILENEGVTNFLLRTNAHGTFLRNVTNRPMRFFTNDIQRMEIFANGNISINSAADNGFQLDIFGSLRNTTEAKFATTSGNVMIGTLTDSGQRLQINDSMRLIPTATIPTASAGTMYYDSATNKLKLYDGTNFVDLN